eukprot:SAG25_NODE_1365_length_3197_cov_2.128793_2_plen_110_part_00
MCAGTRLACWPQRHSQAPRDSSTLLLIDSLSVTLIQTQVHVSGRQWTNGFYQADSGMCFAIIPTMKTGPCLVAALAARGSDKDRTQPREYYRTTLWRAKFAKQRECGSL